MIFFKKALNHAYQASFNTLAHDGIEQAGYLAFMGLLTLFPFMVFLTAMAGFFGAGQAGSDFINMLFAHLPEDMWQAIKPRITEILSGPPQGLMTLSIVGAIWTSSSQLEGYRNVLNRAYQVATPPSFVLRRLVSIAQTVCLSFILLIIMLSLVFIPVLFEKIPFLHQFAHLVLAINAHLAWISLLIIFTVVATTYYILPNIQQDLHSVAPGAGIVSVLLTLGAHFIGLYISDYSKVNVVYGSLGGVIAILLFFYISNIIFIFGAEFNYLVKRASGELIEKKVTQKQQ